MNTKKNVYWPIGIVLVLALLLGLITNIANGQEAPDCIAHDVNVLHPHYNVVSDCWYDHSHYAQDEAGPSQEFLDCIGGFPYTWMTSVKENRRYPNGKHEGFNYHDVRPIEDNWIIDNEPVQRVELIWHAIPINHGMSVRYHSYAIMVTFPNGGTMCTGGWLDYGRLVTINDIIEVDIDENGDPQPSGTALKHTQDWNQSQTWYGQSRGLPFENLIGTHYGRQYGVTTEDNIFDEFQFNCTEEDTNCIYKGQYITASIFLFRLNRGDVLTLFDPNNTGYLNGKKFVDKFGTPRSDCEQAEDIYCVPLVFNNVPEELYKVRFSSASARRNTVDITKITWPFNTNSISPGLLSGD